MTEPRENRKLNGIDLLAESIVKQSLIIRPKSIIWKACYRQKDYVINNDLTKIEFFSNQENALDFLLNLVPFNKCSELSWLLDDKLNQRNIRDILRDKGYVSFKGLIDNYQFGKIICYFSLNLEKYVVH